MNGNDNFDRVLQIQEKSILAWEKTFSKLEVLIDEIKELKGCSDAGIDKIESLKMEIMALKETMKTIIGDLKTESIKKDKDSGNEVLVRWMKIIGGIIILITTITGAIFAILR